jgi:uncharacterized protein (TIGR01777 family)
MRIVMAGSSGFLGTALRHRLGVSGHEVIQLVRREPTAPSERRWQPDRRQLDPTALAGADAVINLAGVGVEDRRWNPAFKELLRSSRVDTTATLADTMATLPTGERPGILLNSSAVGFYGDTGDTAVDEDSPPGEGFLAEMCQQWESANGSAEQSGVRVVKLRTGLVLDSRGGFLKPLTLIFKLFAGGRLGDGLQWMPWITLYDWTSAVVFLLDRDIAGPVNVVGPAPTRNVDFTRALAKGLHRPAIFPTPRLAVRIALGEFGNDAVAGQRALPAVLGRHGFEFRHPDLDTAIRAALTHDLATTPS